MLILGRLCTSALLISLVYVVLTIALVHHLRPSVLSLPRPVNNQQYFLLIDTLAFALVPLVLGPPAGTSPPPSTKGTTAGNPLKSFGTIQTTLGSASSGSVIGSSIG